MTANLPHPDIDQLVLANLMGALADDKRLAMISYLAGMGKPELTCSQFSDFASKTALSYHLGKLREAGLVRVRPEGTRRFVSLRTEDLDARFPGLIDAVVRNAAPFRLRNEQIATIEAGEVEASR